MIDGPLKESETALPPPPHFLLYPPPPTYDPETINKSWRSLSLFVCTRGSHWGAAFFSTFFFFPPRPPNSSPSFVSWLLARCKGSFFSLLPSTWRPSPKHSQHLLYHFSRCQPASLHALSLGKSPSASPFVNRASRACGELRLGPASAPHPCRMFFHPS